MDNITKEMSNNTNTGIDTNADAGNTSSIDNITEEISNNINIGVAQSGGVGRADKGEESQQGWVGWGHQEWIGWE